MKSKNLITPVSDKQHPEARLRNYNNAVVIDATDQNKKSES